MKKLLFIITMFLCINVYAEKIEVNYRNCIDGDTAWFTYNDEDMKVRFIAINAPELEHEETPAEYYSEEAKKFTCEKLESAKKIELEFDPNSDKQDKYERYIAWVFTDNKLLQEDIVKNGYAKVAYVYDDYKYLDKLYKAEKAAQRKNLGIWKDYENESDIEYYFLKYKDIIILIGILIIYIIFKKKR